MGNVIFYDEEARRRILGGAEMLYDFFRQELKQYLTNELHPIGQRIIEACLHGASVGDYENLLKLK